MLGTSEMMVVFVLALILFGPEKLPEIARTLGQLKREAEKIFEYAPDERKPG